MSGIGNAKQAMDWMHPNDRQSCGNCIKSELDSYTSQGMHINLRCIPGGFFTPRHAICGEYEPMKLTDGSVPK